MSHEISEDVVQSAREVAKIALRHIVYNEASDEFIAIVLGINAERNRCADEVARVANNESDRLGIRAGIGWWPDSFRELHRTILTPDAKGFANDP